LGFLFDLRFQKARGKVQPNQQLPLDSLGGGSHGRDESRDHATPDGANAAKIACQAGGVSVVVHWANQPGYCKDGDRVRPAIGLNIFCPDWQLFAQPYTFSLLHFAKSVKAERIAMPRFEDMMEGDADLEQRIFWGHNAQIYSFFFNLLACIFDGEIPLGPEETKTFLHGGE